MDWLQDLRSHTACVVQASILAAGNSGDPKLGRAIRGHSLLNSQNPSLWRSSAGKRQTRFFSGARREPELWIWTLRSPACLIQALSEGLREKPGSCGLAGPWELPSSRPPSDPAAAVCQVRHQPGQHHPVWPEHRHGAHGGPGVAL